MTKEIPASWGLGLDEVKNIYDVEKELAKKLKIADKQQRRKLYSEVYEEYFKQLPFHPQFTIKKSEKLKADRVGYQLRQILPFLHSESRLLEIGAGDCSLSIAASTYCKEVIPLEVSEGISEQKNFPENVRLIIFDGFDIPLSENSVDVAYSNQLMEHLHPDDAIDQLHSIFRVLKPGGKYICITPNRISGPHDVSRFFSEIPLGFHLREYTAYELRNVFLQTGFKKTIAYTIVKGKKIEIPFFVVSFLEKFMERLSPSLKTRLLSFAPLRIIFNSIIAAVK